MGGLHWIFVAVHRLSLVEVNRAALPCVAQATHCSGFSCGAQALGTGASVVAACGVRSCGALVYLLQNMWNFPEPGIEPVSPALGGGLLSTVLSGKSFP